jgi:hypothetical protein
VVVEVDEGGGVRGGLRRVQAELDTQFGRMLFLSDKVPRVGTNPIVT